MQKQINANLHKFTFALTDLEMQNKFMHICINLRTHSEMQKQTNANLHEFTFALTRLDMQQQINVNLHNFTYTLRDAKTN